MITLINNKKIPNVKMVIGIVNMINNGLTKLFKRPSTTATKTAVMVLSTFTPLNKKEAIKTATAVTNVFARNFFIVNFCVMEVKLIGCLQYFSFSCF